MYVFDTDVISYHFTRKFLGLSKKILSTPPQLILVSIISKLEIEYGMIFKNIRREDEYAIRLFLKSITLINITPEVANYFCNLKAELRRNGNLIPDFDLLIASTALAHGATLVTNNTKHFERIPGLKVENWTKDS